MHELLADYYLALNYSTIGSAAISAFAVLSAAAISVLFDRSKRSPRVTTDTFRRSETKRANDAERRNAILESTLLRVRAERTVYREALIRIGRDPDKLLTEDSL